MSAIVSTGVSVIALAGAAASAVKGYQDAKQAKADAKKSEAEIAKMTEMASTIEEAIQDKRLIDNERGTKKVSSNPSSAVEVVGEFVEGAKKLVAEKKASQVKPEEVEVNAKVVTVVATAVAFVAGAAAVVSGVKNKQTWAIITGAVLANTSLMAGLAASFISHKDLA